VASADKTGIVKAIQEILVGRSVKTEKGVWEKEGKAEEGVRARRRRKHKGSCNGQSREGGKRISTMRYGTFWLMPQEVAEEVTWRRELRRSELIALC